MLSTDLSPATIVMTIAVLPFVAGLLALVVLGRGRKRPDTPALVFHSVAPGRVLYSHYPPNRFSALVQLLASCGRRSVAVRDLPADGGCVDDTCVALTFDDGFENFFTVALPILERHGMVATVFPVASFVGGASTWDALGPRQHMSAEQLRAVACRGHEIGSHTLTHPDLTLLPTPLLKRELVDSRKRIEDMVDAPVSTLSFPFGAWDRRVLQETLEAGYSRATAYRGHGKCCPGVLPVLGVYAFDTEEDLVEKLDRRGAASIARARAKIMPHFARGTALWRFRHDYLLPGPSR